jgi:hypothetical protein
MRVIFLFFMMYLCFPVAASESLILDIKSDDESIYIQITNNSHVARDIPANLTITKERGPLVFVVESTNGEKFELLGLIDDFGAQLKVLLSPGYTYGRRYEIKTLKTLYGLSQNFYKVKAVYKYKENENYILIESEWIEFSLK